MDELLLSKIRLGVIAELLASVSVTFNELIRVTETTNGNLGAHLAKLVESGYIVEEKAFVDRRPQTRYRLSDAGRDAFVKHVEAMQSLLKAGTRT
ncbi:MAG: transcriptional regulator [Candidatus Eremiobacteraeota bacterium]|nr:transcriptional regulator [Candidatus Eremiobacteraeota bacterium]